jgi:hypothetical protein
VSADPRMSEMPANTRWEVRAQGGMPTLFAIVGSRGYDLAKGQFPSGRIERAVLRAVLVEALAAISVEPSDE